MASRVKGQRIEEVPVTAFAPLTPRDMRNLRLIIVGEGAVRMNRHLLGRLILDRERLLYVVSASQFWQEQRTRAEHLERAAERLRPTEAAVLLAEASEARARGEALLRCALDAMEGAGAAAIIAKDIRFSFTPCPTPLPETTRPASV